MERYEEELIERYAAGDEELKAICDEHRTLKQQLEAFRHRHYLTAEEELEMKRIQKLKLASKDRIMAILNRYQQNHAH